MVPGMHNIIDRQALAKDHFRNYTLFCLTYEKNPTRILIGQLYAKNQLDRQKDHALWE